MLLVVEEGVWRDVEAVGVGDVVSGFFAWAFVWGDVDPHVAVAWAQASPMAAWL